MYTPLPFFVLYAIILYCTILIPYTILYYTVYVTQDPIVFCKLLSQLDRSIPLPPDDADAGILYCVHIYLFTTIYTCHIYYIHTFVPLYTIYSCTILILHIILYYIIHNTLLYIETKAAHAIDAARSIGAETFSQPHDLCTSNNKLNMIFVSQVYTAHPELDEPEETVGFSII